MNYFIGVDVGTGSVRAGIFDSTGKKYAVAKKDITTWSYEKIYKEQSSDEIWNNICEIVNKIILDSGVNKEEITGIGFDATCSLVALDKFGQPITVSKTGNNNQNIILWMDHRASEETNTINSKNNKILDFVGGKVSIEMEIPKLLWLKNNLPSVYDNIDLFFDLPDFLVYKATGETIRSLCSLGCKWNYLNHEKKWSDEFFKEIGLNELVKTNYKKIGGNIKSIGEVAKNLSNKAARELGLTTQTQVGVSIIDAHAGGIGVIGIDDGENIAYNERLALIGGTSSCHMAVSSNMIKVNGIWGPYFNAMLPDMWLLEGGQSLTGALIDYIIKTHPAYNELEIQANKNNRNIYEELNFILDNLSKNDEVDYLTKDKHILPYFIGNRSPRANADLKGIISGIGIETSIEDMAITYLATIQAIAYGTRHIIEVMNQDQFNINKIFMTGGGTKNPLFLKTHSNITECKIFLGEEEESVLLGAAILGAVSSKEYANLYIAMEKMSNLGKIIEPNILLKEYHDKKYKVFKKMYEDYISYNEIMNS